MIFRVKKLLIGFSLALISAGMTVSAQATYSVSGTISGLPNNEGVLINFTINDVVQASISTNSLGAYGITDITQSVRVEITPQKRPGYTVTPASYSFTGGTADVTGQDFVFTRDLNYNLPANIVDEGEACWGPAPTNTPFGIREKFRTPTTTGDCVDGFSVPLVGDLNGDGKPEIVMMGVTDAYPGETSVSVRYINIYDGQTGNRIYRHDLGTTYLMGNPHHRAPAQLALADLDEDGIGEIVLATNDGLVRAFKPIFSGATITGIDLMWTGNIGGTPVNYAAPLTAGQTNFGYPHPYIADLNGDGIPEVIIYNKIFNGHTGALLMSWQNATSSSSPRASSIASGVGGLTNVISGDPTSQTNATNVKNVAMLGRRPGNGSLVDAFLAVPAVVDIDGCGEQEIICGNRIHKFQFNSLTDHTQNTYYTIEGPVSVVLREYPNGNTTTHYLNDGFTRVADIDGDGKLDVIVFSYANNGNEDAKILIYVWDPTNSTVKAGSTIVCSGMNGGFGIPLIGDINGKQDGWDGMAYTRRLPEICLSVGRPFINRNNNVISISRSGLPFHPVSQSSAELVNGNYNGNGVPYHVLGITYDGQAPMLDDRLCLSWAMQYSDRSHNTAMTLFDFNNDGAMDICHRDESTLRVISVATGNDGFGRDYVTLSETAATGGTSLLFSTSVTSGTGFEYPVIADVNMDGSADILITQSSNNPGPAAPGFITVYEYSGTKWTPGPAVWNQGMYDPRQVREDLKINARPISMLTPFAKNGQTVYPYNNSWVQQPIVVKGYDYVPVVRRPDASLENMEVHVVSTTVTEVALTIANYGTASVGASSPVSFYNGGMSGNQQVNSTLIGTQTVGVDIFPGEVVTRTFTLAGDFSESLLWARIMDDGALFPATGYEDCDLSNNMLAGIDCPYLAVITIGHPGNNVICGINGSVTLIVTDINGNAFDFYHIPTYQWYKDYYPIPDATDSIYIATEPGVYYCWVTDNICAKRTPVETITFDPDCRIVTYSHNVATDAAPDSIIYTKANLHTIIDCPPEFTPPAEMQFWGWNTEADGSGEHYHASQQVVMTADLTLYAEWDNFHRIWDWAELAAIKDDLSANYRLMTDLNRYSGFYETTTGGFDMTGIGTNPSGWRPLGVFTGYFDGNEKTISDLWLNRTDGHCGLFSELGTNSRVINLSLSLGKNDVSDPDRQHKTGIVSKLSNVGGLAGLVTGNANNRIFNVRINNGAVWGLDSIGGLIGMAYCEGIIIDSCSNNAVVRGTNNIGGLVGAAEAEMTIYRGQNTGSINGVYSAGGLVGENSAPISMDRSNNTGAISGSNSMGGIIGRAVAPVLIDRSQNMGAVSGYDYCGGIIGEDAASVTLDRTYNTGAVNGHNRIGGLIGRTGDASIVGRCHNIGSVGGLDYIGGLIGESVESATISGSYNLGEIAGASYIGGLIGDEQLASGIYEDAFNLGHIKGDRYTGGLFGCFSGTMTHAYNAGRVSPDNPYSQVYAVIGAVEGTPSLNAVYYDSTTSSCPDGGGHSDAIARTTVQMIRSLGSVFTASEGWGYGLGSYYTYPYLLWQLDRPYASDDIQFISISMPPDQISPTTNPNIVITLPTSGSAKNIFNVYTSTSYYYYEPFWSNSVTVSTIDITANVTPVSVGVMSESHIVAFDMTELIREPVFIREYAQAVTCYSISEIDVLSLVNYTCNRNTMSIVIAEQPLHAANVSGLNANQNLPYQPYSGFTGLDSLKYHVVCNGLDTIDHVVLYINVVPCPDNIVEADCFGTPVATEWGIDDVNFLKSDQIVNSYGQPYVGDVDGCGKNEVLVWNHNGNGSANAILIFDDSLRLKYTIPVGGQSGTNSYSPPDLALAFAKMHPDSLAADIFVVVGTAVTNGVVKCYRFDGTSWSEKWRTSAATAGVSYAACINIGDINNDGNIMLYIDHRIFNAQTGALLLNLPDTIKGKRNGSAAIMNVLADMDNNGTLEAVAGTRVYELNITNLTGTAGNSFRILYELPTSAYAGLHNDGFTSVVDVNLDGFLDVILSTDTLYSPVHPYILAWDPQDFPGGLIGNPVRIGYYADAAVSRVFAGDVDNDGYAELVVATEHRLYCLRLDSATRTTYEERWNKTIVDASGMTYMCMFDFNQDNRQEIVYRDEQRLRIIDGETGAFMTEIPCYSPTIWEGPIVADLNGDGHAQIIVAGNDISSNTYNQTYLRAYSSAAPGAWAPARSVWNQFSYNAVNINEDLTVPRYQMNPSTVFPNGKRPFNSFLKQPTMLNRNGDQFWPLANAAPDRSISDISVTGNAVTITVGIENKGNSALGSPIYLSLYKNSIFSANLITTVQEIMQIFPGETGYITVHIPDMEPYMPFNELIISVNDDGVDFPVQAECDATNNEISFLNPLINLLMKKDATLLLSTPVRHNGTYANPVSVLYNEEIEYKITAVNINNTSGQVVIRDVLPSYLEYVPSSASTGAGGTVAVGNTGGDNPRDTVVWTFTGVAPMETLTVTFRATPVEGVCASQPLFINTAWVTASDTLHIPTNSTYHQGACVSNVTFSSNLGGLIFNAEPQALDYKTSARTGITIVPNEGYRFTGWSHDTYLSLRGEPITAQTGIMYYDTLIIYGNVHLTANFAPEEYPIAYYLNGGYFPPDMASDEAIYSQFSIESPTFTLAAPEKADDVFTGWTGSNGDEPQLTVTIPHGSTGARNYYANFLYGGREGPWRDATLADDMIWVRQNELCINTSNTGSVVRIYTPDGIMHHTQTIVAAGETKIKLPRGIYIVTLNNGTGKKVIIN